MRRFFRIFLFSIALIWTQTSCQNGIPIWTVEDLGGWLKSEPSVVGDGDRRAVFYQGTNGRLWMRSRGEDGAWAAPVDLGIFLGSAPAAVASGIDRFRVFFRSPGGALAYADVDHGIAAFSADLNVATSAAPSPVRTRDGKYHILFRGLSGGLLELQGEPWTAPVAVAPDAVSGPAAVVPYGETGVAVFYANSANKLLKRISFDGSSSPPVDLGIAVSGAPSAVSGRRGRFDVFTTLPTGEIVRVSTVDGVEKTGIFSSLRPAALDADEFYFRGTDGHLWRATAPQEIRYPKFNQVSGIATHNSYWINRNHWLDPFASGTQELILDQLLHERVRALEIDVHTDDGHSGVWTIYHTNRPDFSQVHTIPDLLDQLRVFHYAVPEHEPIVVIFELKNTDIDWWHFPATEHNFDAAHTIAQFDQILRAGLGDLLYSPRDFLSRAAPGSTMLRAGAVGSWPTTDELRGRFLFAMLGNWSNATYDWARYAGEGDVADRACFPMRSIFKKDGSGTSQWPGSAHDSIPADWMQRAYNASIFWQVEELDYSEVPTFLAKGGIVRGAQADSLTAQKDRLARGHQLIQLDYPWSVMWPTDPSRRLFGAWPYPEALVEPGLRMRASGGSTPTFAWSAAPLEGTRRWETLVSTTRIGDTYGTNYPRKAPEGGIGGLRAAADGANFVEVLRIKTGASGDGWAQERLTIRVGVVRAGVRKDYDFSVSQTASDQYGSLIGLSIVPSGGGCVVRAFSAGRISAWGTPAWRLLRQESFSMPLLRQGIVFTREALFVGTRISSQPAEVSDVATREGGAGWVEDYSYPK